MGEKTQIEWADSTVNFAWGCTKVSAGCEKCYMFRLSQIFGKSAEFHLLSYDNQVRKLKPLPKGSIIFVNSMSDTFHEEAQEATINMWFKLFAEMNHLTFIILTKRVNRAYNYFKDVECPSNCWIGTSVENKAALHRLEKLRKITNVKTKFLSCEPLLEGLGNLDLTGISWVIVGGESDSNPRPMADKWAYDIKNQCKAQSVPFFFKQMGGSYKDKATGTWGSDKLLGKEYKEMPKLLATKKSSLIQKELLQD